MPGRYPAGPLQDLGDKREDPRFLWISRCHLFPPICSQDGSLSGGTEVAVSG